MKPAKENTATCDHKWLAWKIIGYTGDWFHPHIVQRECEKCRQSETDEH